MMKKIIRVLMIIAVVSVELIQFNEIGVAADSYKGYKDTLAKAYKTCKQNSGSSEAPALRYAFADINGDKKDEMIVYDQHDYWGRWSPAIYSLIDGKGKKIFENFSIMISSDAATPKDQDVLYYRSKRIIRTSVIEEGYQEEVYAKWNGKKYKVIAVKSIEEDLWGDMGGDKTTYQVKGKNVTAKRYKAFVSKQLGKNKAKRASKLKWKQYQP